MPKQQPIKSFSLSRRTQYLLLFSILILTAIVYASCLKNGFVNWDDGKYVYENPDIKDWHSIKIMFSSFYLGMYQPLTTLSFLVDFKLSGLNPFQFHLTNFLFHLLNVGLVFLLIIKLTKNTVAAAITALFFAIHPLHSESVCWISERKDVLYSFFYLASLIAWIQFQKSGRLTKYYVLSIILFLFSLLSKSAAVTLPILVILTDYYLNIKINIKNHYNKIPFLIIAFAFGVISIFSQQLTDPESTASIHYSIINRMFYGLYALSFYIVNILLPLKLSALHPFPIKVAQLPLIYYLASVFVAIVVGMFFWLYRSHKVKRETKKEIYFGIWFFLISISLVIFIPVGQAVVAERYTYIPYIGPFFILGWFFSQIYVNDYKWKSTSRSLLWLLLTVMVIGFSTITIGRIAIWKDSNLLFSDIIKKYPKDASVAYNNRSIDYKQKGKMLESLKDLNIAISIQPDYADAYSNRGLLCKDMGNFQQAITDLSRAISLKPKLYEAYYNRGLVYNNINDYKSALEDFNICIQMNPILEMAYNDRGISKIQMGNTMGALADFSLAIKINPENPSPYFNRGITRLNNQDQNGACSDFQKASQLGSEKAGQYLLKICK